MAKILFAVSAAAFIVACIAGLAAAIPTSQARVAADSGEGGQAFHLKADSESGRWRTAFR